LVGGKGGRVDNRGTGWKRRGMRHANMCVQARKGRVSFGECRRSSHDIRNPKRNDRTGKIRL